MGRKKRKKELKPFCFYCNRGFDEEKILIQHQKAKHFKCPTCNKKMQTVHALVNHMFQVHKEGLKRVPNSKKGRDSVEVSIYGMQGVPPEVIQERMKAQAEGEEEEEEEPEEGTAKKQKTDAPTAPTLTIPFVMPGAPPTGAPPMALPPGFPGMPPFGFPGMPRPPFPFPGAPPQQPGGPPPPGAPAGMMPPMPGFPPMPMGFPPMPGMGRGVAPGLPAGPPQPSPGQSGPPAPPLPMGGMGRGVMPPPIPMPRAPVGGPPIPAMPMPLPGAGRGGPGLFPAQPPSPALGQPLGADFKPIAGGPAPGGNSYGGSTGVVEYEDDGEKKGIKVTFVFKDPAGESMEEKRASLPKYRIEDASLVSHVQRLSQSIQARMKQVQDQIGPR